MPNDQLNPKPQILNSKIWTLGFWKLVGNWILVIGNSFYGFISI